VQCSRESTCTASDYYSTNEKTATPLNELCTRIAKRRVSTALVGATERTIRAACEQRGEFAVLFVDITETRMKYAFLASAMDPLFAARRASWRLRACRNVLAASIV
jgi:hypothetical protein